MNIQKTNEELLQLMVPHSQLQVMRNSEELMTLAPALVEQIRNTPALYAQEDTMIPKQIAYLHYFAGGSDWWITELSIEERLAFGYVCLNGDWEMAELGYVNIDELTSINVVNIDLHWTPKALGEITQRNS